jgi:drug/metabolite transporter (DMT)-like permease
VTTLARSTVVHRLGGRVIGAFAIVYVIWGSTYLFIRLASETIPPLLMAGIRFIIAGAILLAITTRMSNGRERDPIGRRQWGAVAVTGALLLLGGNGGVAYGEQFVPSGTVALLVATVPLFIALFSALFLGQRLRRVAVVGIGVGLLGTAVLLRPGGGAADPGHMLLVLVSPLSWATGSLYATRGPLPKRLLVATGMEMLCGGAMLLVAGVITGELPNLHLDRISLVSALSLVYLVVFGSLVAYTAYVWLLSKVPTTAVATYAYVNPLVAVLLGWAFLGEHITGQTLLAAALIIVAVVLILSRPPVFPRREPDLPVKGVA